MEAAITFDHVTKIYRKGAPPALSDFTTHIAAGKIVGLLGRNGAGKTTLLNIITNRIFPSTGSVTVFGRPAEENDAAQSMIFCMTEKGSYPVDMKVKEGFTCVKDFYVNFDSEYAASLCQKFKLDTNKRIKALSTGYASIFKIILTLASGAPVLIFDEPVLGLDAGFRDLFYKELLARYAETSVTIVISTHLIEEVANLLEDVIILKNGEIIADCPAEELQRRAYIVSGEKNKAEAYAAGKTVLRRETVGGFVAITVDGTLSAKEQKAFEGEGLSVSPAKLQEVFVSLTVIEGEAV